VYKMGGVLTGHYGIVHVISYTSKWSIIDCYYHLSGGPGNPSGLPVKLECEMKLNVEGNVHGTDVHPVGLV